MAGGRDGANASLKGGALWGRFLGGIAVFPLISELHRGLAVRSGRCRLAVVTTFRCIASAFVRSVDYPRASSCLPLLTERDLWSDRPLTSPFCFCALYCPPPVHTCNSPRGGGRLPPGSRGSSSPGEGWHAGHPSRPARHCLLPATSQRLPRRKQRHRGKGIGT